MNKALWSAQALLACAFMMGGGMKILTPYDVLTQEMTWVKHVPSTAVFLIGILEILGAIGLILPSILKFKPALTPLAALALLLTMICAAILHISIGELSMITPNLFLGGMASFVAWGRFGQYSIKG